MSVRSSVRELAVTGCLAAVVASCGKPAAKPPEADPAQAAALAERMVKRMPAPASVRECTPDDFEGATSLTYRSLLLLANQPLSDENYLLPWINPPELDAPAVRTLLDEAADTPAKRQAAAQLLGAKFFVVHRVDVVNAPIALQIKHLARGTIHARALRFETNGTATCVLQVEFQNDQKKSDWAISVSNKSLIDPAVAKAMQDDLREQYLKVAPAKPAAK